MHTILATFCIIIIIVIINSISIRISISIIIDTDFFPPKKPVDIRQEK